MHSLCELKIMTLIYEFTTANHVSVCSQASIGNQVSVWSEEIEWRVVLGSIQHIRARQSHDSGQARIAAH